MNFLGFMVLGLAIFGVFSIITMVKKKILVAKRRDQDKNKNRDEEDLKRD